MKEKLETKAVGFYFIVLAALLGVSRGILLYRVSCPAGRYFPGAVCSLGAGA